MKCPKCPHFNDAGATHCTQCGIKLGKRKCANGHTVPEGLTDCPYCPKKTIVEASSPAPAAKGGRKGTVVVNPSQLPSGNTPAPAQTAASNPPPKAAPSGRGKTMVVTPDQAKAKAVDPAGSEKLMDWVPNTGASPLAGFLVSFSTDPNGIFWPLRFGRTSLGSAPNNEITLDFPDVSSVHAMINVRDNKGSAKIWLSDNNSMNGTALNGDDIFNERPDLNSGDVIKIGAIEMRLVLI